MKLTKENETVIRLLLLNIADELDDEFIDGWLDNAWPGPPSPPAPMEEVDSRMRSRRIILAGLLEAWATAAGQKLPECVMVYGTLQERYEAARRLDLGEDEVLTPRSTWHCYRLADGCYQPGENPIGYSDAALKRLGVPIHGYYVLDHTEQIHHT